MILAITTTIYLPATRAIANGWGEKVNVSRGSKNSPQRVHDASCFNTSSYGPLCQDMRYF